MIESRAHARNPRTWLAAAAVAAVAMTGCSSSSSGGGDASTTGSADHSETFHNISPAVNKMMQSTLSLMRGVARNTYQNGELVVTFTSSATKADQTNVENIVQVNRNAATAKPASPKPQGGKKK